MGFIMKFSHILFDFLPPVGSVSSARITPAFKSHVLYSPLFSSLSLRSLFFLPWSPLQFHDPYIYAICTYIKLKSRIHI